MKLPLNDWQFWIVSAFAACALLYLLRNLIPAKWSPFRKSSKGRSATLTIGGKAVDRK
ncbi:MAG: hypothetical protein ACK54H_11260 [Phycisphaerales bacterium]|jgi:hypothetical protein